jgi:hypothetical protein
MADPSAPAPPYPCPMPAPYENTPFDQLPPALRRRVLAATPPTPPEPSPGG